MAVPITQMASQSVQRTDLAEPVARAAFSDASKKHLFRHLFRRLLCPYAPRVNHAMKTAFARSIL